MHPYKITITIFFLRCFKSRKFTPNISQLCKKSITMFSLVRFSSNKFIPHIYQLQLNVFYKLNVYMFQINLTAGNSALPVYFAPYLCSTVSTLYDWFDGGGSYNYYVNEIISGWSIVTSKYLSLGTVHTDVIGKSFLLILDQTILTEKGRRQTLGSKCRKYSICLQRNMQAYKILFPVQCVNSCGQAYSQDIMAAYQRRRSDLRVLMALFYLSGHWVLAYSTRLACIY